MYIKKDKAGSDFKTKIQIAIKDILKPLKIPKGLKLMVVFDCWWYSAKMIKSCRDLGYHITCQIKSDKKILLYNGESLHVKDFAKQFGEKDFKKIKVNARGKEKTYFAVDQVVGIDKTRSVHLVIPELIPKRFWIAVSLMLVLLESP